MGLIRKHQFGQHVLVSCYRDWVLVFHHRPTIDVERSHEDVFDMVLGVPAGVLRAQLAMRAGIGVVAPWGSGG